MDKSDNDNNRIMEKNNNMIILIMEAGIKEETKKDVMKYSDWLGLEPKGLNFLFL